MTSSTASNAREVSPFFFLGDHPVLDFLNTVLVIEGEPRDLLEAESDVIRWLELAGMPLPATAPKLPGAALLGAARHLRELVRLLLVARGAGLRADPGSLNQFLTNAGSYPRLRWESANAVTLDRLPERSTAEALLGPLAEAAAELLVTGDFDLIRRCEDPACVLWFYDRTRSHHRRWCSMAACGNRNKVKAFRQRQIERGASARERQPPQRER